MNHLPRVIMSPPAMAAAGVRFVNYWSSILISGDN
jgi:hypothetical protein